MAKVSVEFAYFTGVVGSVLPDVRARLHGSWDASGYYSDHWSISDMIREEPGSDPVSFRATIDLDIAEREKLFRWGVSFVYPDNRETWAIPTEVRDRNSREQHCSFRLSSGSQMERYYLTHNHHLGANRARKADGSHGIRFGVWAPNAKEVDVVMGTVWDQNDPERTPKTIPISFSDVGGGYIDDEGGGAHPNWGPFPLVRGADGVWESSLEDPRLANFAEFDHKPYMYRIRRNDGSVVYRTDLYSRCQLGYGSFNPRGRPYAGLVSELDGTVSCSVVVDPGAVTEFFIEEPPYLSAPLPKQRQWPEHYWMSEAEFWADEFRDREPPKRIEDLIIYELHLGALGYGKPGPGTLENAIALLDHLVELGVNAVELLPLAEFGGGHQNWGYATSHFFAIEYGGGGRDQYKFFIREAHRRGIVVIMDVVYNHFAHDAERAEYQYDSPWPDHNIYYWYEGTPFDYAEPDGGYVDNMSTAYAPRYCEEIVRKMFIGSAVALLSEFHVDGFRVDQTTSIHSYNILHADGRQVPDANIFGGKLLREFTRTLRMVKPDVLLIAEDHSEWDELTLPVEAGGAGFDARWYSDFYHHLIGDTQKGPEFAKLIHTASQGDGRALAMDYFAGALRASPDRKLVYNESHDEAGNSGGPFRDPEWNRCDKDKEYTSHRTIVVAAGGELTAQTRRIAEARCRLAYGVTVFSAGTPMFLFGEEVGAERRFKYNAVLENREDLLELAQTSGAGLFRFYRDANLLRLASPALRSRNLEVSYVHNEDRLLAFRRWQDGEELLVIGTLSDDGYPNGYKFPPPNIPEGRWQEIFNSDSFHFGGSSIGNSRVLRLAEGDGFEAVIPPNGLLIFKRVE